VPQFGNDRERCIEYEYEHRCAEYEYERHRRFK
jgi:hypothetical protein